MVLTESLTQVKGGIATDFSVFCLSLILQELAGAKLQSLVLDQFRAETDELWPFFV